MRGLGSAALSLALLSGHHSLLRSLDLRTATLGPGSEFHILPTRGRRSAPVRRLAAGWLEAVAQRSIRLAPAACRCTPAISDKKTSSYALFHHLDFQPTRSQAEQPCWRHGHGFELAPFSRELSGGQRR